MAQGKKTGSGFRETLRALKKSLPEKQPDKRTAAPPPPSEKGEDSFEEEMKRLAVTRLGDGEGPEPEEVTGETPQDPLPPDQESPALTEEDEEAALFIAALGNIDRVFRDQIDFPETDPASLRLKNISRKRIDPEEILDLHGLTRTEALHRVGFFLENAFRNGLRTVLIVTGKGKGSESGGVLRAAVTDFLDRQGEKWVTAWGYAPPNLGGEGALVVLLRSRPR